MTGQSEGGEVLGEEARRAVADALAELDREREWRAPGHYDSDAAAAVAPYVAALAAQARADGIEEGRGDMEHLERRWQAEERNNLASATGREERVHVLKTWPQFFRAILSGEKTFEVRSEEGRGFHVGDVLRLEEWDPESKEYTGVVTARRVTYVLRDTESPGVVAGFAVLGIKHLGSP